MTDAPSSPEDLEQLGSTLLEVRPPHEGAHVRIGTIVVDVLSGVDSGRSFTLDVRRRRHVTAGRAKSHDIVLLDPSVSLSHFELVLHEFEVELRDLDSKNGIWVEKVGKILQAHIVDGVEFRAGKCRIRIRFGGKADVPIHKAERYGDLVGRSVAMREIFVFINRIASAPIPVLILGETGTGKELVARALHEDSHRKGGPFLALNCASITRELAESMLFGHKKGAFTGATTESLGYFGQANGGTLFLDEVGELPLELQPKLLRALQNGEIVRGWRNDAKTCPSPYRRSHASRPAQAHRYRRVWAGPLPTAVRVRNLHPSPAGTRRGHSIARPTFSRSNARGAR